VPPKVEPPTPPAETKPPEPPPPNAPPKKPPPKTPPKPGPASAALLELIEEDMRSGDRLLDVPY
jgi:hypothetical protein